MGDQKSNPLDLMGETATMVAALTGIKRQFTDAGWDERNAERLVIVLFQSSTKGRES